jgi:hypothetical protein
VATAAVTNQWVHIQTGIDLTNRKIMMQLYKANTFTSNQNTLDSGIAFEIVYPVTGITSINLNTAVLNIGDISGEGFNNI